MSGHNCDHPCSIILSSLSMMHFCVFPIREVFLLSPTQLVHFSTWIILTVLLGLVNWYIPKKWHRSKENSTCCQSGLLIQNYKCESCTWIGCVQSKGGDFIKKLYYNPYYKPCKRLISWLVFCANYRFYFCLCQFIL